MASSASDGVIPARDLTHSKSEEDILNGFTISSLVSICTTPEFDGWKLEDDKFLD